MLTGHQVQVSLGSQAGSRAYTEFDTETSHQEQVFGNGGVHDPNQVPTGDYRPGLGRGGLGPRPDAARRHQRDADHRRRLRHGGREGKRRARQDRPRVATAAARVMFAAHPNGPS